ncbi:hypothetical protein SO802_032149 [Lithocarpus litseifolius]|uniref:Uncharacterized protein n=1 Tax=Lithocarpus litseifolius TaxID=425828 RepID=A0AAW2BPB8_9ROSI
MELAQKGVQEELEISSTFKNGKATNFFGSSKVVYTATSWNAVTHRYSILSTGEELEVAGTTNKPLGFISACADKPFKLATTYSPEFLSLKASTSLWPASNYGKDIIIGVTDSGIWPEHPSFEDNGRPADGCIRCSDVVAGMDQAIADVVDVICIAMGYKQATEKLSLEPIAKASFSAIEKGISVATAAGNTGPY